MDSTPATMPESTPIATLTPPCILFPSPSHHEQAHEDLVYYLALTAKHLITASKDQTVRVWDLSTQHLAYAPLQGHVGSALCIAILEAQDLLFTGGVDGHVRIWQLSTGKSIATIPPQPAAGSVLSLAASARFLVASYKDKIARVWTLRDVAPFSGPDADGVELVRETAVLHGHGAAVNVVLISSDDAFVVTASGDRTIRVWEAGTWSCVRTLAGHEKGVACLAWMGEKLVSGGSDETIRVWDLRTGVEEACWKAHTNIVRSICVVRVEGEEVIVSGSYDGMVVVWGRVGALGVAYVDGEGSTTWKAMKRFDPADILGEEQNRPGRVFRVACDGTRIYVASQVNVVVAWEIGESSSAVEKVEMLGT